MPESKRLQLRLTPHLFDTLHRWADDELRSINGQIEYLLTDQARRAGRLPNRTVRRPPVDPAADEETGTDVDAASDGLSESEETTVTGR